MNYVHTIFWIFKWVNRISVNWSYETSLIICAEPVLNRLVWLQLSMKVTDLDIQFCLFFCQGLIWFHLRKSGGIISFTHKAKNVWTRSLVNRQNWYRTLLSSPSKAFHDTFHYIFVHFIIIISIANTTNHSQEIN